jgi:AcrR family transcriptional regulator
LARFTHRMTAEARKRQIVEVALDLISKYGLQGVTMSRIAAGVGITQASLYTHFDSRQSILLAALDVIYEKIYASRDTPANENSLERLRAICEHHLKLWADQGERHHAHLLLEFIAGAPGEGLRQALAEKHLGTVEQYAQIVEDGKREGIVPEHVDPEQVAWLLTGWAFAGDVCHLMGFKAFLEPKVSAYWLDLLFEGFESGHSETAAGDAPLPRTAEAGRRPALTSIKERA